MSSISISARLRRDRWIYLFLLPTLILYGAYSLWPILASWWYSLQDWDGFSAAPRFVGLSNYAEVLDDKLFWNSIGLTALFMVITVPLRVLTGLALALLLNHPRLPLRRVFRTVFFLPVVTTTAIIGVVMQFVFDPASGPVELALQKVGVIDQVDFLGSAHSALGTVMVVHTWKWVGVTMIYWLAALQTVSHDTVEAAHVDGATGWQTLRHITLPLLIPFFVIITLLTMEQNLQIFDLMMTMTGGGPFYSTEVIELYIYRWAFDSSSPRLGYASAAAVILGLMLLIVGVVQLLGVRAARRGAGA